MSTILPASILGSELYKIQGDYWVFKVKRAKKIWNNKLGCCKHDFVVYNKLTNLSVNFTMDFEDALSDKKMQRIIDECVKVLSKQ